MALLKKEDTLFETVDGEIKPIKRKVVKPIHGEYPDVEFKPITRKEYREMLVNMTKTDKGELKTTEDLDKKIVMEKFTSPQYTESDIDNIPTNIFNALISTIMVCSGISTLDEEDD